MAATSSVDSATDPTPVLRVEKGHADAEELAALTAVLIRRAAALAARRDGSEGEGRRRVARWRRPDSISGAYGPRSWKG